MMRKTMTRFAFGAVAAAAVAVVAAPGASAAPAPVFASASECNQAGVNQVAVAGGPGALSYYCEKTEGVGAGVAGCPTTASDGCIGEYYILRTVSR